jgi:triacylglycerol lipase
MTEFYASDSFTEFDTLAKEFSLKNALFLAKVSRLVYQGRFEMEFTTEHEWYFPKFAFLDNDHHDTQALIIGNEENVIVAFRGTEGKLEDWITNIAVGFMDRAGGRVHQGFWNAMESIFADLVKVLNEFCTQNQRIWLTGHSLGGALATLATAYLHQHRIPLAGLYTYGQPRVGDSSFAYHLNSEAVNYFRIVNHGDVVTRVPPSDMEYAHAGAFYYLTEDGLLSQDMNYWNLFWQNTGKVLDDFLELAIFGLQSHEISDYIQKLAQILESYPQTNFN